CEFIHTEPYICINAGLGTIDDARHWVEYCNESRHTYWADQRRKNGREEPYKVKYWALGNEIDGPWQMGNKSAEEYAKFALEAAKAMRQVDRNIKLVASGSSNYGADWIVWYRTGNREKLEEIYNFEDALAMGMFFNSFFRHANIVKMANLAQMVNVIAPIMTNKQGLFLQPTYFPILEYGKQRGNTSLDVWVSAPTYQIQNRPPLRYLDVSAS